MTTDLSELYFEDVEIGFSLETDSHTVTPDDIRTFAEVTRDHHPLHTDEEFCRRETPYGGIIAHGIYGVALMEGLKFPLKLYYKTSLASLGWDNIRFRQPILPGDTVRVRVTFVEKRPSSRPGRGVVRERVELIRQDDVVLTDGEHITMLMTRDRPAVPPPS